MFLQHIFHGFYLPAVSNPAGPKRPAGAAGRQPQAEAAKHAERAVWLCSFQSYSATACLQYSIRLLEKQPLKEKIF